MIPIAAGLADLEAIGEGLAGGDAGEANARHAIHLERKDDAVPVDRSGLAQAIRDPDGDGVAFAPAQRGPGQHAVDGGCDDRLPGEVDRGFGDHQVEFRTAQNRGGAVSGTPRGVCLRESAAAKAGQSGHHTARRQALHETTARKVGQNNARRSIASHEVSPRLLEWPRRKAAC
ncbi:hypothetical protein D3C87_1322990 [compost metagenome]